MSGIYWGKGEVRVKTFAMTAASGKAALVRVTLEVRDEAELSYLLRQLRELEIDRQRIEREERAGAKLVGRKAPLLLEDRRESR